MEMNNERTLSRIHAKCKEDGDCLLWTGKVNGSGAPVGHGSMRREYWLAQGKTIPDGKVPVPSCGRPACLEHLMLKSYGRIAQESIARPDVQARRKVASRLAARAIKLDAEKVRAIRESDMTQRAKAAIFNISQGMVSRIERGLAWPEPEPVNFFRGL